MLCALTVRRLEPGTFQRSYDEQLQAIAPFVESVGTDGLYEIVEEWTSASDPAV
jgi:hypothetical protein